MILYDLLVDAGVGKDYDGVWVWDWLHAHLSL